MKLAEVKDYVFISSCEMFNTFIIERSGRVRLYLEGEAPGTPGERRKAELAHLFMSDKYIKNGDLWSWAQGYLPILELKNNKGECIELLAWDEKLYVKTTSNVFTYPGEIQRTIAEFDDIKNRIALYWKNWFESGYQLDPISPEWDNAWRSSIVQSKCAFQNELPKYGVEKYAEFRADSFPPAIISMLIMLIEFEHYEEARRLASFYLERYVRADGTLDYYGPAVSEYACVLLFAVQIANADETGIEWFNKHLSILKAIMYHLFNLMNRWISTGGSQYGLIVGAPEADTRDSEGEYLHNNLMVLRAFIEIMPVLKAAGEINLLYEVKNAAGVLERRLQITIKDLKDKFSFLPYRLEQSEEIEDFTSQRDFAYANYRYYPEMLQTGLLPREEALKIIEAREQRGGETLGMTVLSWPEYGTVLDNWPLFSYAQGLAELGEMARLDKIIDGHFNYYQSQDTYTAYESITLDTNPRVAVSDWCVPAQLSLAILLKWKQKYTPFIKKTL